MYAGISLFPSTEFCNFSLAVDVNVRVSCSHAASALYIHPKRQQAASDLLGPCCGRIVEGGPVAQPNDPQAPLLGLSVARRGFKGSTSTSSRLTSRSSRPSLTRTPQIHGAIHPELRPAARAFRGYVRGALVIHILHRSIARNRRRLQSVRVLASQWVVRPWGTHRLAVGRKIEVMVARKVKVPKPAAAKGEGFGRDGWSARRG
ncbi:hypothetical protein FB451DRAFT_357625 [Mycena latifolia]|nr:hypothetical protein FB451DRAFT_357625 [Mycena latifolia]